MAEPRAVLSVLPDAGVAGDDPAAWDQVYRSTVVLVYRYIYARVGNRADAEDLTTQVYMRALHRLRLAASAEEIRGYLVATARSVLAEHWRRHFDFRVEGIDDDFAAIPGSAPTVAEEDAGVRRAAAILARLPDHYRKVLELRFLRGYSVREVAAELGITATNAKVLQHRALRRAAAVPEDPA